MTSTNKNYWILVGFVLVIIALAIVVAADTQRSYSSPEERQRQDFVDGCKYYSNGAPDTSTKPWRCLR